MIGRDSKTNAGNQSEVDRLQIGGLVFPGFELLDIFGPLELFGMLGDGAVITMMAESVGEVRSHQGPAVLAETTLDGTRELDALIVPGGWGTRALAKSEPFLASLRAAADRSRYVASVCTGSGLLARAGLLDGRSATTNKINFDWPVSQGPRVNWVRQARWVEDGKYFTSSGVSAGMDMALGLIERMTDRATAVECARRAEYVWQENKTIDPFAQCC